jgi:hypothetical protein
MHHKSLQFLALLAVPVLAIGLFAGLSVKKENRQIHWQEKVNLALRRTAHHMLIQSGDSTSMIPPVIQGENRDTWIIRLERPFNYQALPALLQESFDLHGISTAYDVMLLDCQDEALLLGYNKLDFTEKNEPPCGTREQNGGCYTLQVSFAGPANPLTDHWLLWLAVLALLPLGFLLYRSLKRRPNQAAAPSQPETTGDLAITIGQSTFDFTNQLLTISGDRHNLTYREAKLLQLFYRHPNQLLERDFILQNVWADEGILVGRSVDMFVSRLRKLLRADATVSIVTVHGVGYRLEVNDQ